MRTFLLAVAGVLLPITPGAAQVASPPSAARTAATPAGSVAVSRDATLAPARVAAVAQTAPAVRSRAQYAAMVAPLGLTPSEEQPVNLLIDHLSEGNRAYLVLINPSVVVPAWQGIGVARFKTQNTNPASNPSDRAFRVTVVPSGPGVSYLVDCRVSSGSTYRLMAGSTHLSVSNTEHVSIVLQATASASPLSVEINGEQKYANTLWELHGCVVVPLS
jgi:hypothetical protein